MRSFPACDPKAVVYHGKEECKGYIVTATNADGRNQNVSRKNEKAQRDFLVFYRENTAPSP
jgi:hypothetical protein